MNDLVQISQNDSPLYAKMHTAIVECYSVDDCKAISDQANAIAAYYKQVKDDASVRKFLAVKLRAWRRIGEIFATIDDGDCDTQTAYIHKIQVAFKDTEFIQNMTDWNVIAAVKIARLPEDWFEQELGQQRSASSMLSAYQTFLRRQWEDSPAGQAELKRQADATRILDEQTARKFEEKADDTRRLHDLVKARDAAFAEVGVTFDRRDRETIKEIVLLLKEPVHARLRQAAFDQHMTMQAILRAGLAMWFFAHGYDPDDDFVNRGAQRGRERNERHL